MSPAGQPFTVVVGSGGVGKTTLAAAMGLASAARGHDTLVMTFDPSLRLKDDLGVGEAALDGEAQVDAGTKGRLAASLLDARGTFDRLISRYAPDEEARQRILGNRWYDRMSGGLSGVLEYMAVQRLFEVASEGRYRKVILDTPPARQALDFLTAPQRVVSFLDSGALRIALKPWFGDDGHLKATSRLGFIGRNVEAFLDKMVGLDVLRDMAEFMQAFAPLYDGFRSRALKVQRLLRSARTGFVLVSGAGAQRVTDTLFFARRLGDEGYHLGPVVVNRVHPRVADEESRRLSLQAAAADGRNLLAWLGVKDHQGLAELKSLLGGAHPMVEVPLLPEEPTDLQSLQELGELLERQLSTAV